DAAVRNVHQRHRDARRHRLVGRSESRAAAGAAARKRPAIIGRRLGRLGTVYWFGHRTALRQQERRAGEEIPRRNCRSNCRLALSFNPAEALPAVRFSATYRRYLRFPWAALRALK